MFSKVKSASLHGITAHVVEVEADVSGGLPVFEMCGNLTGSVKEAKFRIITALKNSGYMLRPGRVTINISPANMRKDGTGFDLAIALAILAATGHITDEQIKSYVVAGELALNGDIVPVKGILPIVEEAVRTGTKDCIIPAGNAQEGAFIDGARIYGLSSLKECVGFLQGSILVKNTEIDKGDILKNQFEKYKVDFSDIKGQIPLKRATMIAASSLHNIMYIGPHGSGKTMAAERIPSILPEINIKECKDISKIYSVSGLLGIDNSFIIRRPFRAVHHTVTAPALVGGGQHPVPGEISLSNKGVLFLDELTKFNPSVVETLRQPMESRRISLSRLSGRYDFPADFMLVAAINPCVCGFFPDPVRCKCTEAEVRKHYGKLSRPILDRIDMCVQAPLVSYEDVIVQKADSYYNSDNMRKIVGKAFERQRERFKGEDYCLNSHIPAADIRKYCAMDREAESIFRLAYKKFELSVRGCHRIMKVARTIADIEENDTINAKNISEALSYRPIEYKNEAFKG